MAKTIIKNRYGTVPNELLNSELISFRAKGLFAYIQSKSDGWDFSVDRIKFQTKESTDAIISAIKELELAGYLLRKKYQNDKGHWSIDYILFDKPTFEEPVTENPVQEDACIGKPLNNSNKDSSKKDISNKEYSYADFILILNSATSKKYKGCSKSKKQFEARIAEGRTLDDFKLATENAVKDTYHKDNNFKYLTPEFLTRADKLDKFCQAQVSQPRRTVY